MNTKDYLQSKEKKLFMKSYAALNRAISRKLNEREKWKSKAEKVTTAISGMPRGNGGENPRELAIVEMMECDLEANRLIDQLCDLRERIRDYMLMTGDNDECLLALVVAEK